MDREPSDLNQKNSNKLTRRRIMKIASAAGFSSATAAALTPEDVKAADSDQVTIAFDIQGEVKHQVPADWYDHLVRARDVRDNIEKRFLERNGVSAVGLSAGKNQDNPHVQVTLTRENEASEERRGEIPERENEVRVDIEERPVSSLGYDCDREGMSSSDDEFPGSIHTELNESSYYTAGAYCTIGSQFFDEDTYERGWSTAAHCYENCDPNDYAIHDYNAALETWVNYGNGIFADHEYDIAYIEPTNDISPISEVVDPSDHSNSRHIHDTVSEDGMATVENEDSIVRLWAVGSDDCNTRGNLYGYDQTWNEDTTRMTFSCTDTHRGVFEIEGLFGDRASGGDSGGLWHVEEPNGSRFYAVGSHSFSDGEDSNYARSYGIGGYAIQNAHNYWWTDF